MKFWLFFSKCVVSCSVLGALGTGCSQSVGPDKPCLPGCVDEATRLECDANGEPHAVRCPESAETCAAPSCHAGECSFRPAAGAPCGPDGSARCNAAYACLGPALQLTAIRQHTCALADDGKVWCWGGNQHGELGDGTRQDRANPVPVRGLPSAAVSASAGYGHTCALLEDEHAYCWGDNRGGQVAPTGTADPVLVPTLVTPDLTFKSIHAGLGHTCGVTTAGKVSCWGNTSAGQCGIDPADGFQVGPTEIPGLDRVINLETVKNHICAVRSANPTLVCWGSNQYLEGGGVIDHKLGPAGTTMKYSATPLPVDLGAKVVDVGMGFESTYAVTEDGTIYSWGYNLRGQLGTGTQDTMKQPTPVLIDAGVPLGGALRVLRSDGSDQCAEMKERTMGSRYVCWGSDDDGELAFGVARLDSWYAKPAVVLPDTAAELVHGEDHGCVTLSGADGVDVACFGKGLYVADGSSNPNSNQPMPARVAWDPNAFASFLQ